MDLEGDQKIVEEIVVRDDAGAAELAKHDLTSETLRSLKKAKDNHTVLIPQPSEDPRDPLNWTPTKKWAVLLAVSMASILPDYGSATGAVTLIPQGLDWGLDPNYVNHSQVGNVITLGAGGLFAVVLSNTYGRWPTVFWMLLLSVVFAVLCAAAQNFNTFMAARILAGFFSSPAQATGLIFVKDMYFFHEQVRKVNLWTSFFLLSPYLGPIISAAVLSHDPANVKLWHWSFGEFAILSGLALLGIALFADETWYNRSVAMDLQPARVGRLARMTGYGRPISRTTYTLRESAIRLIMTFSKIPIFIVCISFGLTFAWVVGIATVLPLFLAPPAPDGYGFGYKQIALFWFTPVVAVILGETIGHFANYRLQQWFIRKRGVWVPENRLWINWLALPLLVPGLVIIGLALERHYHYMLVSLGWGMYVCGIMIATTGYYQYCLDCYPADAGEVSAWINFFRTIGGFIISYEMVDFVKSNGALKAYGILAALTGCAFLAVPLLQIFGHRFRSISGPVPYASPSRIPQYQSSGLTRVLEADTAAEKFEPEGSKL